MKKRRFLLGVIDLSIPILYSAYAEIVEIDAK